MIELVNKLPEIKEQGVALARIGCTFCAYGAYPKIALFWQQKNESGEITALFSLLDGHLTVFAREVNEELRLFIKALSPATVFAEEETAINLGVVGQRVNVVAFFSRGNSPQGNQTNVRKIYNHFKNDFNVSETEFIADISHRLRHGAAFCVLKEKGAAVVQRAGDSALITGICVEKEGRKKGLGSEILKEIKTAFSGRLYACCEDSILPFYLKNSFEQIGFCVIGRI